MCNLYKSMLVKYKRVTYINLYSGNILMCNLNKSMLVTY